MVELFTWPTTTKLIRSRLLFICCALFAAFGVIFSLFTLIRILTTFELHDFAVYHRAAVDVLSAENPYRAVMGEPFIYPPTALIFLAPLGLFSRAVAENIWTVGSFMSAIAVTALLVSVVVPKASRLQFVAVSALLHAFVWLSFPAKFTLGMGQINFFVLFLVVASFVLYSKKWLVGAGMLLACAAALKLTPLLALCFYVRKQQWRVVLSFVAGLVGLSLVAVMRVGWEVFAQYWQFVLPALPTVGNGAYYNQAFTGFLARAGVVELGSVLNGVMFCFVLLVSWVTTRQKHAQPQLELGEYGLFLLAGLIGGGLTWQHHLVGIIVPATALVWLLWNAAEQTTQSKKTVMLQWFGGILAYFLVAYNSKEPLVLAEKSVYLLSHGLYGSLLLFIVLVVALNAASALRR